MTIEAVRDDWPLYTLLVRIMFSAVNGEIDLESDASPVEPFPKAKRQWARWAIAAAFFIDVKRTLELTQAALRSFAEAVAASERLAAAVQVPQPSAATVREVVEQLAILNEHIKKDQRFHAALEIGTAVAATIEKERKASA